MTRTWIRELAGWLAATVIAVATVAHVASTARSELLFRDGDSLVVALVVRSIADGSALDWALSTVLFLPEIALFGALWLLGRMLALDVDAVLAVNAVVNLTALYGALRLAAGRRRDGRGPVAWSVIALAAFCTLAVTETSSSRDALELASLLLTTTYYSATVIATVVTVGLVRRWFDRERDGERLGRLLPVSLATVAAVSTLTNPLYAAWATVPLGALLAIAAVYPRSRSRALPLLWWLLGGTALGLIGRIPFSAWIANSGAGYAHPELWPESARYYGALLGERFATAPGVAGTVLLAALLIVAVWRTVRAASTAARLVAAAGWMLPVAVTVGAIALGTDAARYLQPVFFAPVLGLVATPVAVRLSRRAATATIAAAAAALLAAGALSVPRLAATQRPDAAVQCVVDWVEQSGRTGAGQFWTVRLPKLHLADPARLVQVDHQLRGYAWLVNRTDFAVGEVSFLVEDAQSSPWGFAQTALPTDVITCGRYTIHDFAPATLPLGPNRS